MVRQKEKIGELVRQEELFGALEKSAKALEDLMKGDGKELSNFTRANEKNIEDYYPKALEEITPFFKTTLHGWAGPDRLYFLLLDMLVASEELRGLKYDQGLKEAKSIIDYANDDFLEEFKDHMVPFLRQGGDQVNEWLEKYRRAYKKHRDMTFSEKKVYHMLKELLN